ncbi:proline-, glutamic acid- and leucine-rich protein 1-like [Oryx dammah]|uniref:proline-, glutamic acid- and leucine-rich protein 1-like n=1 Tax=Oryx dammah TaxID=59534 RepID=UPI001A9B4367|nr:proline-, glutamic acid- and leucine-rich protein 1-like [Oryx dammah]
MDSSEFEIVDAEEPANIIEIELSESSDSMDSFNANPVMSDDFNTVSLPSIPASPEMYLRQSFESEPEMGHVTYVSELKHAHKLDDMDEREESDEDVQENQEDQEDEEDQKEVQEDQQEFQEDQEEIQEGQQEFQEDQEEIQESQEDHKEQEYQVGKVGQVDQKGPGDQ